MFPGETALAAKLAIALAAPLAAGVIGRWRMSALRTDLAPDWRTLADFGAALRAFTQSAGHDREAFATLVADTPAAHELILGATPPDAPAHALFTRMEVLGDAFGEPGFAATDAERRRLEDLRGQVLGAEWLLQTEMKRLSRKEADPGAWVLYGVAGVLLLVIGRAADRTAAERTRRRTLELDPRFEWATRIGVVLMLLMSVRLAFGPLADGLAQWFQSASGTTGT